MMEEEKERTREHKGIDEREKEQERMKGEKTKQEKEKKPERKKGGKNARGMRKANPTAGLRESKRTNLHGDRQTGS